MITCYLIQEGIYYITFYWILYGHVSSIELMIINKRKTINWMYIMTSLNGLISDSLKDKIVRTIIKVLLNFNEFSIEEIDGKDIREILIKNANQIGSFELTDKDVHMVKAILFN
jgi:hypothetical protein